MLLDHFQDTINLSHYAGADMAALVMLEAFYEMALRVQTDMSDSRKCHQLLHLHLEFPKYTFHYACGIDECMVTADCTLYLFAIRFQVKLDMNPRTKPTSHRNLSRT